MLRSLFVLAVLLVPMAASAAATPAPGPSARVRDGGVIAGRITAVDYQKSTLDVDAGSRGRMTVTVMPTTSIQAKDAAYHTISDLKSGERVEIMSSLTGDTYTAQIIRILP